MAARAETVARRPSGPGRSTVRSVGHHLDPLFPPAPPRGRTPRWVTALLSVAALFGGAAALLTRQVGLPSAQTVWAEDGAVFLSQQYLPHPRGGLFLHPYNGYMHLVPRLLARLTVTAPIADAAFVLAAGAALVVAAVALLVFHGARAHVPSVPARLLLALAVVALPMGNFEVLTNVANLQWYLLFAMFWVLLWRPRGWAGTAVSAATALLATMTSPLTLLLLPLVALRAWRLPGLRERVVVLAWAAGLAVQLAVVLRTTRPPGTDQPEVGAIAWTYLVRIVLGSFGGVTETVRAYDRLGATAVLVAVLALVLLLLPGLLSSAQSRLAVGCAGAASVAYFVIPMGLNWSDTFRPEVPLALDGGGRYSVVPTLLLLSAVAISLGRPRAAGPAARARTLVPVVLQVGTALVLLTVLAVDWHVPVTDRGRAPTWATGLALARAGCAAPTGTVRVPIQPASTFSAELPCRVVLAR